MDWSTYFQVATLMILGGIIAGVLILLWNDN